MKADPTFWRLDGDDMKPGAFQTFAVLVLQQNWVAVQNGRPGYLDEWLLLQQLATAWNGVHAPPGVSYGMLGSPLAPGYALAPKTTYPPSGDFGGGVVQLDILRVRGHLLNGTPQWSMGNDFNSPVPDSIKALVVNVGPSTAPPPPPPPPPPGPGQPGFQPGHL